jgi:hypothetical protein
MNNLHPRLECLFVRLGSQQDYQLTIEQSPRAFPAR